MKSKIVNNKSMAVDGYLAALPGAVRAMLGKLRQTIKKAAPEAEEVISYGMPAFRQNGMLVWYAAFKHHYSFFAPLVMAAYKKELVKYKTSKSGISLPFDTPVPVSLVTRMVKSSIKKNIARARMKKAQ